MTEPTNPEPPSKPSLSASERIFVRISIWQTVLSIVGLFVGAVALYAALTESDAVRRQTAASVWPYVQVTTNDFADQESASFAVTLTNAGVGPAHVRAMRVTVGGVAQPNWEAVMRALGGDGSEVFSQAFALNRVLRPGESIDILGVTDREVALALRDAVAEGEGAIELCYCSIFDQCWVADGRTPEAPRETVRRCPDYGAEAFGGAAG